MKNLLMTSSWVYLLLLGCGTIVGNPKKPGTTGQTPNAIVYQIPLLGLTVPDAASDTTSLALLGDNIVQEKMAVVSWAKRLNRLLTQIDRVTETVNAVSQTQRQEGDQQDVLRFKSKGRGGQLSGVLQPLAVGGEFQYQARLCHAGKVFAEISWTADGKKVAMTRDFSAKADGGTDPMAVMSTLTVTKMENSSLLDLKVAGAWSGDVLGDGSEGPYITERAFAEQAADGGLKIKMVRDLTEELPGAGYSYHGDEYLVASLRPNASGTKPKFDMAFVAYMPRLQESCHSEFDEASPRLFQEFPLSGGFCIGRPFAAKRFSTADEVASTLAELSGIGVAKASDLTPLAGFGTSDCD